MRSLILAGGGIKVGYQAGCLQVLLDEAGLRFDHIDAASGGCFNAAMICSGKSGTDIASAWRSMNPLDMVSFNLPELRKGPWARSIATADGLREKVFVDWGLDFERIRQWSENAVTFNTFNFSKKRLLVLENKDLDVDYLCACVSLMVWFPPVEKNGDLFVDSVYTTDANLDEAIRRGATELWAIWSVADRPEIRNGLLAQYFHILEQSADGNFFAAWQHLQTTGRQLHLLRQEVPIHYLFNFSRDRMAATVDLGIRDMREYCYAHGLLDHVYALPAAPQSPIAAPATSVRFSEVLTGYYFVRNAESVKLIRPLEIRVTVETGELGAFVRQPEHRCDAVGQVDLGDVGMAMNVTDGSVNLLVDERRDGVIAPGDKRMLYTLRFRSAEGTPYLLVGRKYVTDGPGKNVWRDTTTLYVLVYELDDADPGKRRIHGTGIAVLSPRALLRQLTTFRTRGTKNPLAALSALRRFGQFFIRQCWDVYVRDVIDYAPF